MQIKRHKLTKRREKKYKGGADPVPNSNPNPVPEIIGKITDIIKPTTVVKSAWIMLGLSYVYILNKLLTK